MPVKWQIDYRVIHQGTAEIEATTREEALTRFLKRSSDDLIEELHTFERIEDDSIRVSPIEELD